MDASYREVAYTNGYEFTQGTGYALPEYPFAEPPELKSGAVVRYPVVIVGAGITGLTLACGLARLGVPAVLLVARAKGSKMRASSASLMPGPVSRTSLCAISRA